MIRKKKVLLHTDFAIAKTGFARAAKALLSYLWKTGKYEIVQYCCSVAWSNPELQRVPWKAFGTLPDNTNEANNFINSFPPEQREFRIRQMSYGDYNLDKIIEQERPDIYIGVNDIWGIDYAADREWFKKITSVIHTTLDSRPLLPSAVNIAPKLKNYWIWSSFATNDLHLMGHKHVKTMHGALEDSLFYKLPDEKRLEIRRKNSITDDTFIVGFVSRNQLRKGFPNLIEGYSIWKKAHPKIKSSLLFHTCLSEGWPIYDIAKEYGVPKEEILVTHVCKSCGEFELKPFEKEHTECRSCGNKEGLVTTGVNLGVSEAQLNEVYNTMDVYCHPFTSGGQEIGIQEAKLAELITLVTNYSCGEEMCSPGAGSFPLKWSEYREHGTNFRKASTCPNDIAEKINDVYFMTPAQLRKIVQAASEWTLENYSVTSIGKQYEEFIDSAPFADYSFLEKSKELKNRDAKIENLDDNTEFIKKCYREILKMEVDDTDSGLIHWQNFLKQPAEKHSLRQNLVDCFRRAAIEHNQKNSAVPFESLLEQNNKKHFLIVGKESAGDILYATCLFESFRKRYPEDEWNIYFASDPVFHELIEGNPYNIKSLPFFDFMNCEIRSTGHRENKGYFDGYCHLFASTQKVLSYLTMEKIELPLK